MIDERTLVMLIGLPGSGKSTTVESFIADNVFDRSEIRVLSTDNLIEAYAEEQNKTYNDVFADVIGEATKRINADAAEIAAMPADVSPKVVFWDQTNLSRAKREKIIKMFKSNGWYIMGWVFNAAIDEILPRLERRSEMQGKTIPSHVLESMAANFQPPSVEEGFDEIVFMYPEQ